MEFCLLCFLDIKDCECEESDDDYQDEDIDWSSVSDVNYEQMQELEEDDDA